MGYFLTTTLPDGWKIAQEPILDITDVMRSLACTKEQALKEMNRHWALNSRESKTV